MAAKTEEDPETMHPKLEESKKPADGSEKQATVSEKDTFWITLHQTIISNPQY